MIKNFILLFVITYLLIYIFFKISIPFWSRQPVFHLHNLLYWIYPPGIIEKEVKIDYKYYDSTIEFLDLNEISDEKMNEFHKFINDEYLPDYGEQFKPTKQYLRSQLMNHDKKAHISLKYSFDIENNKFINKKIIAAMTTVPLECHMKNTTFTVLYTDFLCVDKNFRKKNIAPKIIYTHNYNCRNKNPNIIAMFKREGNATLITPITIYNTYFFDLTYWPKKQKCIANNIQLILIDDNNFNILFHYLHVIKSQFDCYFQSSIENIRGMIKDKIIYITIILLDNNPHGVMMFRNSFTSYDNKNSLECFGSCFDMVSNKAIKYLFYNSLLMIKNKLDYHYLWIENISQNNKILNVILKNHTPKAETTMSYYFYNYAKRPFLSKSVLLLN
tara:strand:- start:1587 stop:2747 length:1161 start_codon:yes stop_codon:yes gene_type:complete